MNALNAVLGLCVVAAPAPAFAQFSFDATTRTCVDAGGHHGLNLGVRGPCGDLRGLDLEGANLARLDLRGARLEGARLKGASLLATDLRAASLDNADLTRAVLTGAKLEHASLSGARLVGAHLENASLNGAVLSGADLRSACVYRAGFEGANLRGALFSRNRGMLEGARFSRSLISAGTLPFTASELVALEVITEQVELSRL